LGVTAHIEKDHTVVQILDDQEGALNENQYRQGMARPEIDIGTAGGESKPVSERTTLVTGGAGFIGGHLVRALRDTGRKVVVLDVQNYTPEARFTIGEDVGSVPLERGSIGDQARVLDVFRMHRPDEVVHAGMILDPAYLATNRMTAFLVNVGGVINLLEAMIAFGVPRIVNFSSIGVLPRVVYEPVDGDHPILLHDAGPGTDFYGSTKAAAETMLFAYRQAIGLDFRTIRPSAVYGLGMNQYVGPIKAMVENAVRGEPAHFEFGGAHPRPYTHVQDIAGLVVAMLAAPDDADRIFYGSTGGEMADTTEVASIVREIVPGADVEIGEELSEAEKPVVALRARISVENARAQLGWEPKYPSLRDGIRQYVEHYRAFSEAGG
jgi:UDP-glucose 4-epimerase